MLYLKDLLYALYSTIAVDFIDDIGKLDRRLMFIYQATSEKRKKQLPYRIIIDAYSKRMKYLVRHGKSKTN